MALDRQPPFVDNDITPKSYTSKVNRRRFLFASGLFGLAGCNSPSSPSETQASTSIGGRERPYTQTTTSEEESGTPESSIPRFPVPVYLTPRSADAVVGRKPDEDGVLLVEIDDEFRYNPTTISLYGLAAFESFVAGDTDTITNPASEAYPNTNQSLRTRHLSQADWLVDNQSDRAGAGVWEYGWDHSGAKAPWVSAIGQGLGIGVVTQAHWWTEEDRYLNAAKRAAKSFDVPMAEGGLAWEIDDDAAWFQEVADPEIEPRHILNGHLFGIAGLTVLAEYADSDLARRLARRGISGTRRWLDRFMYPGAITRYDLVHVTPASTGTMQYNRIHAHQMLWLYEMTAEDAYLDFALDCAGYATKPRPWTVVCEEDDSNWATERRPSWDTYWYVWNDHAEWTLELDEQQDVDRLFWLSMTESDIPDLVGLDVQTERGSSWRRISTVTGPENPYGYLPVNETDVSRLRVIGERNTSGQVGFWGFDLDFAVPESPVVVPAFSPRWKHSTTWKTVGEPESDRAWTSSPDGGVLYVDLGRETRLDRVAFVGENEDSIETEARTTEGAWMERDAVETGRVLRLTVPPTVSLADVTVN